MEREIPKPGEKFLDADQKPCQVLCVADHIGTKEKMVVYQTLYGEFKCFVKPLETLIREPLWDQIQTIDRNHTSDETTSDENLQANPALLQFLDADTLEQKYQIIKSLGSSVTNRLIDDFAVTLDLVIPDGNIDIRYQQLLSSLRTMQKFETNRFRK